MNDKPIDQPREEDATPDRDAFPIVGIGGSAGGIDALMAFFPAVSADCGLAFVVIQHLAPDHKSLLPELLARCTRLPIVETTDDTVVRPNKVYVITPNTTLTIAGGRLHLAPPMEPRGQRSPIDTFFASLAHDRGENAACIILSGTGSDGTVGLRAIKEAGGLTMAQSGAPYDSMMRSALGTGLVDLVLQADEMPAALADYFRHMTESGKKKGPDGLRREAADYLPQLCAVLRARTGHDFSGYKDKTIIRRVERRMQVLKIEEVPQYLGHLRKEPREVDLLFQDLLIGVTNFFRDPQVVEAVEHKVIGRLLEGKGPNDTVRVWVPGCATGEEAYSLAILLREAMPRLHDGPKLQIFASDIDEHALEIARVGRYPQSIAKDVPAKLLDRYFQREDGTWRVVGELREICLFSTHNLLRDAPFSRLDMISCRNLMIYLSSPLQSRVIPIFHYALREGGFLVLGSSENVTRHPRLFSTVDKANRIFQARPKTGRALPDFPLTVAQGAGTPPRPARPTATDDSLQAFAERQVLERFAPAYVIVNGDGEILHLSGRTGKYLEFPAGMPNSNLFTLARPGLRIELQAAIRKAAGSGQAASHGNLTVGTDGGQQTIDLMVQPLRYAGGDEPLYMVVFQDLGGIKPVPEALALDGAEDAENDTLRQLEAELRATRERLQASTEELESANEELKSSNEELSSMNEELQSSNEELETSREELQSMNEELLTVNAELSARVGELGRAHSDIANLLESTQIATVFLDRRLAVRNFTPAAKDVFRLVESDTGRPISHVRPRLRIGTLEDDAQRVLRTLAAVEREVESEDGTVRYVMRILPYRTGEDVIAGVVITFVDVSRITAAEARIGELTRDLRNRVESLETILDLVPMGVFIVEDHGVEKVRANRYGARLVGERDGEKGPRVISAVYRLCQGDRELSRDDEPLRRAARTGVAVPSFEGRVVRPDGSAVYVLMSATPLFDERGKTRGAIAAIVDISHRKQAEAAQEMLLLELQHRVKNTLATVSALATRMLRRSRSMEEFSETFQARLLAMGAMHELLSANKWEHAELRAIVAAALDPYVNAGKNNVALRGVEVLLKPDVASTMGLVFHELATNAAKYGALAKIDGCVEISWDIENGEDARRLALRWTERDGKKVSEPQKLGFGLGFVTRAIEYELQGRAAFAFDPAGFRASLELPLEDRDAAARPANGNGASDDR
jgi:two-component system, chemotaxis family, CheB/CheR fusion protein